MLNLLSICMIIFIVHQWFRSNASSARYNKNTTIESMKQELLGKVIAASLSQEKNR